MYSNTTAKILKKAIISSYLGGYSELRKQNIKETKFEIFSSEQKRFLFCLNYSNK